MNTKGVEDGMSDGCRAVLLPIGPSIGYVPLTQGQFALIDAQDAEIVGQWIWYADWNECTRSFYVARTNIRLHSFILKPEPGFIADHINGNTLDNRRSNLRPATHNQNQHNQRMHRNNSTGFRGVYISRNRYRAQIRVSGKIISLGTYDTPEAAHEARKRATAIHHGEFARTA